MQFNSRALSRLMGQGIAPTDPRFPGALDREMARQKEDQHRERIRWVEDLLGAEMDDRGRITRAAPLPPRAADYFGRALSEFGPVSAIASIVATFPQKTDSVALDVVTDAGRTYRVWSRTPR